MGCASSSVYSIGKNNNSSSKTIPPQVSVVYVPPLRVPVQSDIIHTSLRGFIPHDLAHSITSRRNHITLLAAAPPLPHQHTGAMTANAIAGLTKALEEYLPLLLGLAKKELGGLQDLVEFRWKHVENGRKQEIGVANPWFELLSILHMMATLTLMEANLKLIPQHSCHSEAFVSADCMRDAVDLLLKAAGYLNFCVHHILPQLPSHLKNKLASDLHEAVLEAISHQALAQGTEIQLGLAVQSQNATLSVKRRLACEQLSYYDQAHWCLSKIDDKEESGAAVAGKKQALFLRWKYVEAKAAAYYYHGLVLGKGTGGDPQTPPSSHVHVVSGLMCFLAAQELLAESKKTCLTFCLSDPITRCPPPWGAMKHLQKKIPETASKKSQMYGYLLEQEKQVQTMMMLPQVPEFQLSLKPDEYELPEMDPAWDIITGILG